jgi:hypothetical protein
MLPIALTLTGQRELALAAWSGRDFRFLEQACVSRAFRVYSAPQEKA